MSRYTFTSGGHTVVLGWDRPLQTLFAQVWKGEPESDENFDPRLESPHPRLWLGTSWREVPTVENLAERLRPYAEVPQDIVRQLEHDIEHAHGPEHERGR